MENSSNSSELTGDSMDDNENHKCDCSDELIAGPETSQGVRPFIRHTRDHKIVGGVMATAKEGRPINSGGELVQLTHIDGDRFKVESLYGEPSHSEECSCPGPSKVATEAYRSGWDRIFGNKEVGQA
jgi:hypothetical protein